MAMRREDIKKFIDSVSEEQLVDFEKLILKMIPEEDEEISEEENIQIEEGMMQAKSGESITLDELIKDLEADSQ